MGPPPLPGRVLAVDYGRRRVGLAVADPLGITVRGLDTLVLPTPPPGPEAAARLVAAFLAAETAAQVVVGLPLLASGDESEMSGEVRRFAAALREATGLPVDTFDEGLTSWEAEQDLARQGHSLRAARQRGDVDRAAAVALLRSWLAERESGGRGGAPPAAP